MGGNPIYSDELFDGVKHFLSTNLKAKRFNLRFQQYGGGTKIVFYQGNPKNIWGMIEVINWVDVEVEEGKTVQEPVYNIRIHSSILKRLFKEEESISKFFTKCSWLCF